MGQPVVVPVFSVAKAFALIKLDKFNEIFLIGTPFAFTAHLILTNCNRTWSRKSRRRKN